MLLAEEEHGCERSLSFTESLTIFDTARAVDRNELQSIQLELDAARAALSRAKENAAAKDELHEEMLRAKEDLLLKVNTLNYCCGGWLSTVSVVKSQ